MTDVVAFDTETWLIEEGLKAPPLVCLQWDDGSGAKIVHQSQARPLLEGWLASDNILVGHNIAYDFAVIAAQFPDLIPAIFAKYHRDEVTDTLLREQLIFISRGQFRIIVFPDGTASSVTYHLADCVRRHFSRILPKEGWRLFYRAFTDVPDLKDWPDRAVRFQDSVRNGHRPEWFSLVKDADVAGLLAASPEEALGYALEDARVTRALYESQSRVAGPEILIDEFRQARAAFALHLSSCWGIYTDGDAVDALEAKLIARREELLGDLIAHGLVRSDGSADTKVAMAAMLEACEEYGLPPIMTKGGKVSLAEEACARFDDDA